MEHRSILVIGAGLRWSGEPHNSPVNADSEGVAVCVLAAKLLKHLDDTQGKGTHPVMIFITGGWSEEYAINLNQVYKECLIAHGVPEDRISVEWVADEFRTRGETRTFANACSTFVGIDDTHTVYVVDHDFHMKRTISLLRSEFAPSEAMRMALLVRPVSTGKRKLSRHLELIKRLKDFWLYSFWRQRKVRRMFQ